MGAIGEGSAVIDESRNFRATSHRVKPLNSKIQDGDFCFNQTPKNEEIKIIPQQCTYTVRKKEKPAVSALSVKSQGPPKDGDPDDGGNDAPGGPPLGQGLQRFAVQI